MSYLHAALIALAVLALVPPLLLLAPARALDIWADGWQEVAVLTGLADEED